ncbi:tRNA dihydrouridine synthase DusB [Wielerella bovis]|uniref:tRNA dihydrouridine synthase DusB n=1 Tax=Wielerella bovis TaxID=2917790 RepID=UPI0020191527|nr:tRNA dihydrouridine synthase DusB [Wielerella bovis]ULJ59858.1 tRNA dihydrouridine synthase DusB [Wielerella bovis]
MKNKELIEKIKNVKLALAPMAGITDLPFRQIARQFGADWAACEMVTDNPSMQHTRKTLHRQNHAGENGVVVAQIAGSDPEQLASAAQYNVALGAQVIDINMGCPVKKVCNVLSGSALLQNEPLVEKILQTVVQAVEVPVTLKTRLGWDDEHKNILTIAQMAQNAGIAALAIHGRTRAQMYRGEANYDLIGEVKRNLNIPVWANGDIVSPEKAAAVLAQTGVDALMIGRGAQGQPWIFADIQHYLQHGTMPPPMHFQAASKIALGHLAAIHAFYGAKSGVRIARKHIGWYLARQPESESVRQSINQIEDAEQQYDMLADFFEKRAIEQEYWCRDYG